MERTLHIAGPNMKTFLALVAMFDVVMTAGCTTSDAVDGENDRYIVGGKADAGGIEEATAEAGAVLRIASTFTRASLETDVGLGADAAKNIVAYRMGDDEMPASADDQTFETLAELDSIPFVGPIAFAKLLAYAEANGLVSSSDPSTLNNDAFDPAACQGQNISVAGAEARFATNPRLGSYAVEMRKRTCTSAGNCGPWQSISRSALPWTEADGAGELRLGRWDAASPVKLYVSDDQCESPGSFAARFSIGAVCDGIGSDKISCNVYDVPGTCFDVGEDPQPRRLYWEDSQFLFYGKLTENCAQLISRRVRDTAEYETAILTRL